MIFDIHELLEILESLCMKLKFFWLDLISNVQYGLNTSYGAKCLINDNIKFHKNR
jgi:hypothetical protein